MSIPLYGPCEFRGESPLISSRPCHAESGWRAGAQPAPPTSKPSPAALRVKRQGLNTRTSLDPPKRISLTVKEPSEAVP